MEGIQFQPGQSILLHNFYQKTMLRLESFAQVTLCPDYIYLIINRTQNSENRRVHSNSASKCAFNTIKLFQRAYSRRDWQLSFLIKSYEEKLPITDSPGVKNKYMSYRYGLVHE